MAPTEMLARDFVFEFNTGTVGSPSWVEIGGLNKWAHSPVASDADTTKFSSQGRQEHMKASRGDEFTFSGMAQEDPDDGSRDPGQLAVEASGRLLGPDSIAQYRITSPSAVNTLTFLATVSVTVGGGGNDDVSAWEAAVKVTGELTDSQSATVPGAPSSADATAANDAITGTWTAGTGDTDGYEVWVYEDAGDTVVQEIFTNDTSIFATGLANTTAYYFKVRGFNAAGYGAWSTVSDTVTTT